VALSRIRPHLNYSNVVSTICLFILLGGGAYAAVKLPKNSVGTKQLKKNAVKGSKVADGSLTAADISGPVKTATNATEAAHASDADQATNADHAATANQATNAAQLGGATASSFFPSGKVKRVDLSVEQATTGSIKGALLTLGPLTLNWQCTKTESAQILFILGASSAENGTIGYGYTSDAVPEAVSGLSSNLTETPATVVSPADDALGEVGAGELVYRDPNTTISLTFRYFVADFLDRCQLFGVAVQA
jgi:hypothetical protein